MATEYKTIPDLDAASDAQVTGTTLVEIAAASGGSYLSKKATMAQLKAYATSELKDDLAQSASIDSSGLISFKNDSNVTVFTLQLPIYNGGVG